MRQFVYILEINGEHIRGVVGYFNDHDNRTVSSAIWFRYPETVGSAAEIKALGSLYHEILTNRGGHFENPTWRSFQQQYNN